MVRALHNVQVVFDDDHRVTFVPDHCTAVDTFAAQFEQDIHEFLHVTVNESPGVVGSSTWFVRDRCADWADGATRSLSLAWFHDQTVF